VKREHLAAIIAALALAVSSCGGDDAKDHSTPAASGTSSTEQAGQPQDKSQAGSQERSSSKKTKNGSGGSSAPAGEQASGKAAPAGKGQTGSKPNKPKAATPRTPQEHLAALSPAERRRLHKDLYNQGKRACYYFGPEEIAKNLHSSGADQVELARQFAAAYERATPSLILPYQQGCIAGLKKYERNPPKD
jgi:hypothetical protein